MKKAMQDWKKKNFTADPKNSRKENPEAAFCSLKTMICFGDSMVFGFRVRRSECWTALLNGRGPYRMINRGVNGDTTAGMLARFRNQVTDPAPDAVFFLAGSNDIFEYGEIRGAERNLSYMADQCRNRGIRTFISTVTPYYPQLLPDALASSVHMETAIPLREELNGYIRQMTGCIDTSSCFEELPADLQLQYSVDGIHLNARGHLLAADYILSHIADSPDTSSGLSDRNFFR